MIRLRAIAVFGLLSAILGGMPGAVAADYPTRPVHLVVGFSPGGGNDIFARIVAVKLAELLKQPVLVDNKPGAGGQIAAGLVARARPDGYTLLIGASGAMVSSPAVYAHLPYDTRRDFAPIAEIASFPLLVTVAAKSPATTLAELIAYARAHPGNANYASASISFQIATELLKLRAHFPMEMVAYKGSGDSVMAVIDNEVLATVADTPPVVPQIAAGAVRALAVTGSARLPELPNVPTLAEAGVTGANISLWSGIFAPAATPPAILAVLRQAAAAAILAPDVSAKLRNMSVQPTGITGDAFATIIDADLKQAVEVAQAAHIKIDQ